jgi:hypothetical protein
MLGLVQAALWLPQAHAFGEPSHPPALEVGFMALVVDTLAGGYGGAIFGFIAGAAGYGLRRSTSKKTILVAIILSILGSTAGAGARVLFMQQLNWEQIWTHCQREHISEIGALTEYVAVYALWGGATGGLTGALIGFYIDCRHHRGRRDARAGANAGGTNMGPQLA